MKAAVNRDFVGQIENDYAAAYNSEQRPVSLIDIDFRAKKHNIDEPIVERL
ncbi:MAG: hypothetical protein IKU71_05460 [Kiritimatiellae bacterium]|nr:hypothetical protein [Kiritimatiellia bacterium]